MSQNAGSKLWKCVCGKCDPDAPNLALHNCGRCGYLAYSSPIEDLPEGGAIKHNCPVCRDSWWLAHETWSRIKGLWHAR